MTKWDNQMWVEWLKPRHALLDIYISPEAMKDMQSWGDYKPGIMDWHFDKMNADADAYCAKTIVIVSGYYAPLHINHIEMMEAARKLGDELYVIVNNDAQLTKKKGFCFQDEKERLKIVSSLRFVDNCMLSIDKDDSVANSLAQIAGYPYGPTVDNLIFANGGDRHVGHSKEESKCKEYGIKMVYNIGPPKTTSSSELIRRVINYHLLYKGTK